MTMLTEIEEKKPVATTKGKWGGARPNTGGARPGSGRPKGVPNKMTADIKAAILEAFKQAGGAQYLLGVAKENPQVFCGLLGKVLPMTVQGDENGGPIRITWGDE